MTERLYFADSYTFTGQGSVVSITPTQDGKLDLVLDRTVMHPQGGGQPSDTGTITLASHSGLEFLVSDVRADRDSGIVHHFGQFSSPLPAEATLAALVGASASIHVNEEKRRLHARLHSAGHLLDAALRNLGHTHLQPTKGYHFADGPNVEYIGELEQSVRDALPQILNAELKRLIELDGDVKVQYSEPNASESASLHTLSLASPAPSEHEAEPPAASLVTSPNSLRIVNVGGLACPCGGTHVKKLSDIRGIEVTKLKRVKNTLKVYYTVSS